MPGPASRRITTRKSPTSPCRRRTFDGDGTGPLYQFGVEVRVHRWVGITVGGELSQVTGILGNGGLSQLYTSGGLEEGKDGEDDLGGWAFQFRVVVGR